MVIILVDVMKLNTKNIQRNVLNKSHSGKIKHEIAVLRPSRTKRKRNKCIYYVYIYINY